jgi:hypothetical protein
MKRETLLDIVDTVEKITVRPLFRDGYQLRLTGPSGGGRTEVNTVIVSLSAENITALAESILTMRATEERQAKLAAIVRPLEENEDVETPPAVIGDALLEAGFMEEAAEYHRRAKEETARVEYEAKLASIKREFDIARPT